MARLTQDEVRDIGVAAIRRVIGDTFAAIEFAYEVDRDDELTYNYRLQLPTMRDWRNASARMFEMTDAVMMDLSFRDDDHFPFIWLLSDGSWEYGHDAAAE